MKIIVNNEIVEMTEIVSIPIVLKQLNISMSGVAVAVNNEVVGKVNWGNFQIKENDKLTIIRATQGG